MEKIFKYIYYCCLTALIFGVVYLSTVMYLSPRQDLQERGFIPCTKQLVFELSGCQNGKIGCPLKLLWQDMKCNIKVVGNGVNNWLNGTQPTPWANYLFEPELYVQDEENPYNGDMHQDMLDLNQQHDFILKKHQELEAAKQRYLELDTDILMSNPEIDMPANAVKPADKEDEIKEESGDIAAEADIGDLPTVNDNKSDVLPAADNHLEKGMIKNEE